MDWTPNEGRPNQFTAESPDGRWYAVLTRVSGPAWELEFTKRGGTSVAYFETRASAEADAEYRTGERA